MSIPIEVAMMLMYSVTHLLNLFLPTPTNLSPHLNSL
jgi:hypothetical protein